MWHRPFSVPPWTQDAKSSGFMTCLVGNPNRLTFICHSYRVRIRSKQAKLSTVVLNVIDCVCVCPLECSSRVPFTWDAVKWCPPFWPRSIWLPQRPVHNISLGILRLNLLFFHVAFTYRFLFGQKTTRKQNKQKNITSVQKPSGFSLLLCKITLSTGKLTKLP